MTNAILRGKPNAGDSHVRFDERDAASCSPDRRSSRRSYGIKCVLILALASISFGVLAGIKYDYLDQTQRIEVVPSQGTDSVGRGFWAKLMDLQRSAVKWLEFHRGILLLVR